MSLDGLLHIVKITWVVLLGVYFLGFGSGWSNNTLGIRSWKEFQITRFKMMDPQSILDSSTSFDYFNGRFFMIKKQTHYIVNPK